MRLDLLVVIVSFPVEINVSPYYKATPQLAMDTWSSLAAVVHPRVQSRIVCGALCSAQRASG